MAGGILARTGQTPPLDPTLTDAHASRRMALCPAGRSPEAEAGLRRSGIRVPHSRRACLRQGFLFRRTCRRLPRMIGRTAEPMSEEFRALSFAITGRGSPARGSEPGSGARGAPQPVPGRDVPGLHEASMRHAGDPDMLHDRRRSPILLIHLPE